MIERSTACKFIVNPFPLILIYHCQSNSRTPNRSRVETRQFTVRIERIGADNPHITLTNNHNGNGDTYIESDDDEDTDAISYANDQKSVGTQAKLLL